MPYIRRRSVEMKIANNGARDLRLDIMKLGAAFAVVWLHVSAPIVAGRMDAGDVSWWMGNIADAASRWAVPIFVMISGALYLSKPIDGSLREYYRRKSARVLFPIIVWSGVFLTVQFYSHGIGITDAVRMLITGTPYYHMWYLFMILGIYLIAPFIHMMVTAGPQHKLGTFLVLGFILAAVESALSNILGAGPRMFLAIFPKYITYYVAGYYLMHVPARIGLGRLYFIVVMCVLLTAFGVGASRRCSASDHWG